MVKIDVGNFDKNLSLAEHYGNPIKMGIPAVVELGADDQVIYSTKGGELADARKMGEQGIYDFLSAKLAVTPSGASGGHAQRRHAVTPQRRQPSRRSGAAGAAAPHSCRRGRGSGAGS